MIYIPFSYFFLLLLLIFKIKGRFELAATITGGFLTTSFFAIVIDNYNLYGSAGAIQSTKGWAPTLLYIILITFAIFPFLWLPVLKRENLIPLRNLWKFDLIIYFYLLITFLVLLFFSGEIINRIQSQNIGELRNIYAAEGDDLGFNQYSGLIRYFVRIVFILGSEAMFLQVLYFYSLSALNKSNQFNLAILICSMSPLLISMLTFDRSKVIYWALSYIALLIWFFPVMPAKARKISKINAVIFLGIFLIYIFIITVSRYANTDLGGLNSILVYAGQSFNNFCLFYEFLQFKFYNFSKVIPLLNYIFNFSPENNIINHQIDVNVFASFAGMVMKEIGIVGSLLYCTAYSFSTFLIFNKLKSYNVVTILLVVIALYMPYLGIFGIYYGNIQKTIGVLISLLLMFFMRYKIRF